MSNIEDRIVSMTFDNDKFERGLADTIKSLDKLSETISQVGANNGLDQVGAAASGFDPSPMISSLDAIQNKLGALGAIGFTVIQGLTNTVLGFASNIVDAAKTDFLEPIITGGKQRALNIEQAKFMFAGLGLDVEEGMANAKAAVLGTAFGLDEAAKAAAQFGASGIKLGDDMTGALRGVAGAAALTGKSFSEIADIFAGSAGSGKVTNQDLLQFSTRGLNAAAAIAPLLGKTEAQIHDMATAGTLDFKTFADAMNKAFGQHATEANQTYAGSLANLHAAMSRLGASFFTPDLVQQRDLFNALTPVVDNLNAAILPLTKTLLGIKDVGIRNLIGFIGNIDFSNLTSAIPNFGAGLINIFDTVEKVIGIVKTAFRDFFPKSTTSILFTISELFLTLSEHLKIGGKTGQEIKSVFRGIFAALAIGVDIVKGIVGVFVSLFETLGKASGLSGGGILQFFADLGEKIVRFKALLENGSFIPKFFQGIVDAIKNPLDFIENLKDRILSLFNGGKIPGGDELVTVIDRVSTRVDNLRTIAGKIGDVWDWLTTQFDRISGVLDTVWDTISTWFSELGTKLAAAFKPGDFDAAVDVVNVGLLGGIALMLQKFLGGGFKIDLSNGLIAKISSTLNGLKNTLTAIQTELKAEALLKIAEAVALLTGSLLILSLIDSKALTKALAGMTVSFLELTSVLIVLDKVNFSASGARMAGMASSLILVAGAAVVMSLAVSVLGRLDLGSLVKGLIGIGAGLTILVTAMNSITADTAGLAAAGGAMIIISAGLIVLSEAVKSFASIGWADLFKGLVGVAAGLTILTVAMNSMPPSSVLTGAGLIELSTGLLILSQAVKLFSDLGWAEMTKGMVGIAAGLIIISAAMQSMPVNLPITAAGMVVLSTALVIMSQAVRLMGDNDLGTLARGIGGLAATLLILAVAVNFMSGAAGGALALGVVVAALIPLTLVLERLGQLQMSEIGTALLAIGGALAILGLASFLLEPLIPAMIGLGIALGILGGAFALFGIGASLVAKSIEILANSGEAGAQALVNSIKIVIGALPALLGAAFEAFLGFIEDIIKAVPLFIRLVDAVITQLLQTIIKVTPLLGIALIDLFLAALEFIKAVYPAYIETGLTILQSIITGIQNHAGDLINAATGMIVNIATALQENMPMLVDSAVRIIGSFLQELANHGTELATAGINLIIALLEGLTGQAQRLVDAATFLVITLIQAIASHLLEILNAGVQILISFLQGITDNAVLIVQAVANMIITFLSAVVGSYAQIVDAGFQLLLTFLAGIGFNIIEVVNMVGTIITQFITSVGDQATNIADAGANALITFLEGIGRDVAAMLKAGEDMMVTILDGAASDAVDFANKAGAILVKFLNGLADAINTYAPQIREAGANIAFAIVDGITGGMASKVGDVASSAKDLAGSGLDAAKDFLGINSPSKKFFEIGQGIAEGMVLALNGDKTAANSSAQLASRVVDSFQSTLSTMAMSLGDMENFNPTITPVLDLTKVERASAGLEKLMRISPIKADVSLGQADTISALAASVKTSQDVAVPVAQDVTFEQNIYAPTALSTNDIYRNTKSQIALAKEELNI